MRSNHEIATAAMERAGKIQSGRQRSRRIAPLLFAAIFLIAAAAVFYPALTAVPAASIPAMAQAGANVLLAGSGTGGYVLVGIIAFAAGMLVALACLRRQKKQ